MKRIEGLPKVLIVSTNAIDGGASIHIETFVNILKDKTNFLLVFGSDGPVLSRLINKGFDCTVIPQLNNRGYFINDIISVIKLSYLILKFRPTLIHLHSSKAGFIGRIAGFLTITPTIFTVHGWGWRGMSIIKSKIILIIERLLGKIPRSSYIYVSRSVEKEAQELVHIHKNKGCVIVNGTDDFESEKFAKFDKFTIIMPARVSNAKDHKSLVSAFDKLDFESNLILCGQDTDKEEFVNEMIANAPNRYKDIIFLGARHNMKELLNRSHVFALISNFEALPLSIIEAMSASLPVIASNVGGVPELIVEDFNGYLVNSGDIDLIVERIVDLKNEQKRILMGARGRTLYLEKFSAKFMAKSIYSKYMDFIN